VLVPAPDWAQLNRLADRYERTGEGEEEFGKAFQQTIKIGEVLASYVQALTGTPSQS
jgi:hypothetical protein